ncbi:hypothetical protein JOF53_001025 [Crossiella equi]|uniref:Terpene synthase n=1 Tax=Crossiella equi TaxID=130796 RepID=A0ABS5A6C4_9PSEU|nr:hypothetical protein [Crossiella equi]MBP2472153.1 hypothetical protein [Crossiella equi]
MIPAEITALTIPDLSFPFPARLHPDWAELEENTIGWLKDFGFVRDGDHERRFRTQLLGKSFAHFFPVGATERVALATNMCVFYTLWDDRIAVVTTPEELRTMGIRCLRLDKIAADPHPVPDTDDPFEHAYRDLWLRLLAWASPQQAERIQRDMLHNSLGWLVEGAHDLHQRTPAPEDYREIRWATSALSFFVDLNEIVRGFELPLATARDPAVRRLVRLSMNLFTTTNDLHSCARDAYRGHVMNLPAVLAHAHGCSLQRGMDLAAAELRRQTEEFLVLAEGLRHRAEEKLPELIDCLQDMVAGHLVWIRACDRYAIDVPPV